MLEGAKLIGAGAATIALAGAAVGIGNVFSSFGKAKRKRKGTDLLFHLIYQKKREKEKPLSG